MKRTIPKNNRAFRMLFPLFFPFLLGVVGGWYVGQRNLGLLPWQNQSIFSLPTNLSGRSLSEIEPNESLEQAPLLTSGVQVQGTLTTARDIDFYKINVTAPSRIQIALTKLPQEYQLYIYNPSKQLIALSQRRGFVDTISTVSAPDKGLYFIKIIASYNEIAALPYGITVILLPF